MLSVSADASSCVAPSVPGGEVALGHLHPLLPCSTLILRPSHLKIGGTRGLTGQLGLWIASGIPSDTELSEPLVLQGERTICGPQRHHGVTCGDRGSHTWTQALRGTHRSSCLQSLAHDPSAAAAALQPPPGTAGAAGQCQCHGVTVVLGHQGHPGPGPSPPWQAQGRRSQAGCHRGGGPVT